MNEEHLPLPAASGRAEKIFALFCLALGAIVLGTVVVGWVKHADFASMIFPFILALFLVGGGGSLLFGRHPKELRLSGKGMLRATATGANVLLYILLSEHLGFLLSMFAFITLQGFIVRLKWKTIFSLSIIGCLVIYLIFSKLMQVPLPYGLFGF